MMTIVHKIQFFFEALPKISCEFYISLFYGFVLKNS
jgi:hypothetical protein